MHLLLRRARTLLPMLLLACLPAAAQDQNPHDGYAFWLPNGILRVGDAASQKAFQYASQTASREETVLYDRRNSALPTGGTKRAATLTSGSFTVPSRRTRFDTPRGQLVLVARAAGSLRILNPTPDISGNPYISPAGSVGAGLNLTSVYLIPRPEAAKAVIVRFVDAANTPARAYRLYFTDDAFVFPGLDAAAGQRNVTTTDYAKGLAAFFAGSYADAKAGFSRAARSAQTPQQARYARRFIRWCDAEAQYPKVAKSDAKSYYDLGLYATVNGFWELAEKSFKASTAANPKDADAWYMLGDAASYVHSDLDNDFAQVYPYYKKAADLYPRANSNTFRNHLGLFKKLRVSDGKGGTTVLTLTPEQIAETKKKWEWCTAVFEAASRGSMRMVNNWVEYDQEFDNSAPLEHDPAPYEGLWQPGTIDTFMKFTGWGASDAVGPDCGANRSADVNIGMREWDVLYHEWNHTLDWMMAFSGMGIGVPETHSSDWTGFQPISSMGMGHHSCNRYYMTPGMYRAIHGSDIATTPWIDEWLIADPKALPAASSPITEADQNRLREATRAIPSPLSPDAAPDAGGTAWALATAQDGYVDLGAIEREAPRNAYSFAHVYVWSPADRKVRVWLGADDNAKVWVNNRLAYTGNYWSVCKWEETREKDQIATALKLRRGWNSVLMQVTNVERFVSNPPPPHPFYYGNPDAWGFSMRICDFQNQPIAGLKWQARRPPMFDAKVLTPAWTLAGHDHPRPPMCSWAKVKDDYTMDLPHLTLEDLRAVTGDKSLTVTDEMLFDPGQGAKISPARLEHAGKADPNEVALNNELNWFFSPKEMIGVLRYADAKGAPRDLVFLRPEMYESFFALAKVAPEAKARGIKSHSDRVIGYFTVPRPDSMNGRVVLVVDTFLGKTPPVDEEDLLGFGSKAG